MTSNKSFPRWTRQGETTKSKYLEPFELGKKTANFMAFVFTGDNYTVHLDIKNIKCRSGHHSLENPIPNVLGLIFQKILAI